MLTKIIRRVTGRMTRIQPEEIGDETVRSSSPRSLTRSQDKTKEFSYPELIMPSDDSEDEISTLDAASATSRHAPSIPAVFKHCSPSLPERARARSNWEDMAPTELGNQVCRLRFLTAAQTTTLCAPRQLDEP